LAFTFKQFRNNVNAHEKFVQLKELVKRLHRSLSILYTPTKRIFYHFALKWAIFGSEKVISHQKGQLAPKWHATKLCATVFRTNNKLPK